MNELSGTRKANVEFHGLANGPDAVGRDESGKTVFAPFCAPKDFAQVLIHEDKASFARGFAVQLLQGGPNRVAPPCPFYRPETPRDSCGGCHYQHLDLSFQRQSKRENVQNLLRRALKNTAGGNELLVEECVGVDGFNYRNKAEFRVQEGRLGFYAHESHHLVPIDNCLIQHPRNVETLKALNEILPSYPANKITKVLSRVSTSDELFIALETPQSGEIEHQIAQDLRERLPNITGIATRGQKRKSELLWGRECLTEEINGISYQISGEGFWQVNPQITPLMVEGALEFLDLKTDEKALDLFCGTGLFTLHMAKSGADVTGIELSARAISDAKHSAKKNGLKAGLFAGDVSKQLKKFQRGQFEAILLDPPRAGAKESIADLLRLNPQRIVYVSCDPATLARDAAMLSTEYRVSRIRCFDVFPQTAHIESMVLFEKSGD
jgi:23S rRNA (uracil1939-C5)-methyltransferase